MFPFPNPPARTAGYRDGVWFGVLGTLTVTDDDGTPVRLGGPARRRLLAALLARVGRTVPVDTLIDDLWSDAPPATADKTLQSHVVRLRDDLGRDAGTSPLITDPGGYRLDVDGSALDAWCFERDLDAGRRTLVDGDPLAARQMLDQALSWWRGDAYAEFPDAAFAVSERMRLGELCALGREARTEAALALGASGELVADLELRVRDEPYRERSWEQLVVALYRSGRQGDALAAYRRARERMVDDLGLEPSPSLRGLEARVLDQDPSLLAPLPSVAPVVRLTTAASRPDGAGTLAAGAFGGGAAVSEPLLALATDAPAAPLSVAAASVGSCPYRGLTAYGEDDAAVFVGRERLTAELAGRLVDNDLMVLAGPSGAGKSSLVRAGLVPALRHGAIPGSAAWRLRVTTPGADPLQVIESAQVDLLVVDQAEELFTLAGGVDRTAVGRRLAALLSAGTRLVLVLRADFYGRLAELEVFTGRIGAATVLVGPMTEEEIHRVVVEPAAAAGVAVAPGLAETVVADVRGQAGSLPLLSAALERTWHERTGDRLTLEAYHRAGGVRGALESMAEESFAALGAPAQAAARRMLLRMATRSGGVWTRRPVQLPDIVPEGDEAARDALAQLAVARLVTVGAGTAELAHEALLGGWPRLRTWLDERAVVADQLEHLAGSTTAWVHAGRPDADLLRGPRLQAALEWAEQHPDDLSGPEREYVDASRAAVGAELARERRRRRRLTAATAGVAVAALVATAVGAVALHERDNADRAALSADARRLAAQSYTVPDRTTSLLLAAASYRLQDSPDTRGALLSAVQADGGAAFRIQTENRLLWVGAPADGSRLLAFDNSRNVLVFDPASRKLVTAYRLVGDSVGDISPDGSMLAECGQDDGHGVLVADARTGSVVRALDRVATEASTPTCAHFTGNGRFLVVTASASGSGLADRLEVYDTANWAAAPRILRSGVPIASFATGDDRVVIQRSDESLEVVKASDLHVVAGGRPTGAATCTNDTVYCVVAIDRAGDRVAYVDPTDPQTPEQTAVTALSGPARSGQGLGTSITHLAFSPDGTRLAAAANDGSVLVLTAPAGATVVSQTGNGAIQGLAWAGSGSSASLYTDGLDSQIVSWDLRSVPRTVQAGAAVPPDDQDQALFGHYLVGTRPAPGGGQGAEQVYRTDLRTATTTAWPLAVPAGLTIEWVTATPDGARAVLSLGSTGTFARFVVMDMATGAVLLDHPASVPEHDPAVAFVAAPSADGRTLFAGVDQYELQQIDVASGRVQRTLTLTFAGPQAHLQWAIPLEVDPRGGLLVMAYQPRGEAASGGVSGTAPHRSQSLVLVDTASGRTDAQAELGSLPATALAWSPDDARLAVGTGGGTIAEFDAATLAPLTDRVLAHTGVTLALSYASDGSMLVSSGSDGTVAMWDAATLRRLGAATTLGRVGPAWSWVTPTGDIAGTMPRDVTDAVADTWFTMPGTPRQWLADACTFAGRDLTTTEWARYVGDQPFQPTCPARG